MLASFLLWWYELYLNMIISHKFFQMPNCWEFHLKDLFSHHKLVHTQKENWKRSRRNLICQKIFMGKLFPDNHSIYKHLHQTPKENWNFYRLSTSEDAAKVLYQHWLTGYIRNWGIISTAQFFRARGFLLFPTPSVRINFSIQIGMTW